MTASESLCEFLEWDSTFFGRTIARATIPGLTHARRETIDGWCAANRIDCLYFLASAEDHATIRLLEEGGFRLVDIRVTLERQLGADLTARTDDGEVDDGVRATTAADIPALRALAGEIHRNARFHADGRFDRERCDELYRVWIEKSCTGSADQVLTADRDGAPVGYVTLLVKGVTARIGLFGVHPAWRRRGIGRLLLGGALAWLRGHSVERVTVVTQGASTGSQRLYQSAGFRTSNLELWYHRWYS